MRFFRRRLHILVKIKHVHSHGDAHTYLHGNPKKVVPKQAKASMDDFGDINVNIRSPHSTEMTKDIQKIVVETVEKG